MPGYEDWWCREKEGGKRKLKRKKKMKKKMKKMKKMRSMMINLKPLQLIPQMHLQIIPN